MVALTWYFDFISPFAYLQSRALERLPGDLRIDYHPVLLAGLLAHYGHKGPAEIPTKRLFTYRQITWLARNEGVPLRFPPVHPFNPLRPLRLAIAGHCQAGLIHELFSLIWARGLNPADDADWLTIRKALKSSVQPERIDDPEIKQSLRANTQAAIAGGVFGVPSFKFGNQLFFGHDSLPMLMDYLAHPKLFEHPDMRRLDELPAHQRR